MSVLNRQGSRESPGMMSEPNRSPMLTETHVHVASSAGLQREYSQPTSTTDQAGSSFNTVNF